MSLAELGVRIGTLIDFLSHFSGKEVTICVDRSVSGSAGADITIKSISVKGIIKHVIEVPPGVILYDAEKTWKHQYEDTHKAADDPPYVQRDLKKIKYDKIFLSLNSVVEITW
jgi:hypothetical protein